jgi:putative ABC transport system permease protein
MSLVRKSNALLVLSLRSVPQRIGSSLVSIIGIAGVVAVMVCVLSMATALQRTLTGAAQPERAIVLRKGTTAEGASTLSREAVFVIQSAPGIAEAGSMRLASAEVLAAVSLPKRGSSVSAEVTVRGLPPAGLRVRPEIRLLRGRMMGSGLPELIVGRAAQGQFVGLEIGAQVQLRGRAWQVVGEFATNDDARESELIADAETLLASFQRNVFNAVTVRLASAAEFNTFKDALTSNPAISVDVFRESDYYRNQAQKLGRLLFIIAYLIGGIMAVGAMFAAINTMYTMVSTRTVEIATLRALGFSAPEVVVSILLEGLLFSLLGAASGACIAWLLFGEASFSTVQGAGQIVAQLQIDAPVVGFAASCAILVGLLGTLFPAVRAARLPIAVGVRAQ